MFTNLTEQNVNIVSVRFVNLLTSLEVPKEIAPLAGELDLLTVGDEELLWTVQVLDISGLVDLVRNLVVNENTVRSLSCEEVLEVLGELW
mgnify:CR=1 FL=1